MRRSLNFFFHGRVECVEDDVEMAPRSSHTHLSHDLSLCKQHLQKRSTPAMLPHLAFEGTTKRNKPNLKVGACRVSLVGRRPFNYMMMNSGWWVARLLTQQFIHPFLPMYPHHHTTTDGRPRVLPRGGGQQGHGRRAQLHRCVHDTSTTAQTKQPAAI